MPKPGSFHMSFIIIRNDISKISADAIVCTASPTPAIASGTEKAIYSAAGAEKLMVVRPRGFSLTRS